MTTICPHCQAPMPPASEGAARCPNCGYMVLPQRARTCPVCQKLTLASADHCQHCGAIMPPEPEDARKQDAVPGQGGTSWKTMLKLTLLAAFLAICAVGLKNFVQDRTRQRKEAEEMVLLKDFIARFNELQKQKNIFMIALQRQDNSDRQLLAYQKTLDKNMIPFWEELIRDYSRLSTEAKHRIQFPKETKLEADQLQQILNQSLLELKEVSRDLNEVIMQINMEKNPQTIQAI